MVYAPFEKHDQVGPLSYIIYHLILFRQERYSFVSSVLGVADSYFGQKPVNIGQV